MAPDEHDQVTAAAISRLAGVGRAAVSNWRRRYPEFPQPVGGSPVSPTFSLAEVRAWLEATGKADQLSTAGRTNTGTQRVGSSVPSAAGQRDAWAQEGSRQEPERAITDLTGGQLLARAMASLLPRSTVAAHPADQGEAELPVVVDPACLHATLLMAVADRFGDQVRLAGQEIQEQAAAMATLNLRSHEHAAPYEVHVGDSLLDNQLREYLGRAAAVVCEPPFDLPQWPSAELTTDPRWEFGIPSPRDGELAWVQHSYAHLRPRGVAVVAVTPRTCLQQSGQHIRAALVRSGVLRDVIALPEGMGTAPGTNVYLWVLQRPYGSPDHAAVRMVDLSGLGGPADVPHDYAGWERIFSDGDPTIFRAVPRLELLDGDVNLLPSRYVEPLVLASAEDLADVTARLEALYARLGRGLPRFAAPAGSVRLSYVTVGELERAGALTIRPRDTSPLPGDVLVRTQSRPPVVAAGEGTNETGVAHVVELDDGRLDAYFIATFLRTDADALPVANTLAVLSRDDLRRCRVPRLPLAEQRRYGAAFKGLNELREVTESLASVSASIIDQTIYGLTAGILEPGALWPAQRPGSHPSIHSTEGEKTQP